MSYHIILIHLLDSQLAFLIRDLVVGVISIARETNAFIDIDSCSGTSSLDS